MTKTEKSTAAFIISLIAGIFILLGSLYTTMWGSGMMVGGYVGMMGQQAYGAMAGTWILGLISGIIVLISAIMLRIRPGEATRGARTCFTMWGTLVLIFSVVSFFGGSMGGFLIGAGLGIVGGALALSIKGEHRL
jgi:hypothetical protein